MYNVDLMLKIREKITNEPDSYDQDVWIETSACGTTACIAGWACILSDKVLEWDAEPEGIPYVFMKDGRNLRIDDAATEVLDIPKSYAEMWFYASNRTFALGLLDEYIIAGSMGKS